MGHRGFGVWGGSFIHTAVIHTEVIQVLQAENHFPAEPSSLLNTPIGLDTLQF